MFHKINALIERIYYCATDENMWPEVLKEFARIMDVASTAIVPLEPETESLPLSSLNKDEHDAVFNDYFHIESPYYKLSPYNRFYEDKTNLIGDFSDVDFLSDHEIAHDVYYQEFLKKYEWGRTSAFIHKDPVLVNAKITVQRYYGKRNETPQEREIRKITSRHICRSLAFSIGNRKYHLMRDGFSGLCHNMTCAAALLGNDATVVMMNEKCKALIGEAFAYKDGKLSFTNRENKQQMSSLIDYVLSIDSNMQIDKTVSVNCTANKKIIVKIIRLPKIDTKGSALNRQSALLLLACKPGEVAFDVSQALLNCNLTRSEARFAGYVGTGTPPKTAAELTGISEQYARTKLKEIFRKLNVNSQSQLATYVGTLSVIGSTQKTQGPPMCDG
ncbi:helix-turn-helix transcriptional regulator [Acetobacter sp.]|uniref:helix-turn-helix transcriptional regulator n=1 Tax=Acetobacter sp. TaxID=440 RepID=UPI0039E97753